MLPVSSRMAWASAMVPSRLRLIWATSSLIRLATSRILAAWALMSLAVVLIVVALALMLVALPEIDLAVPLIVLAVPLILVALPLIAPAVPLMVPPVLLMVPAVPLIDLASPSTDWARVITWASLPSSGLALVRMELAVLMPWPFLAMFSALWLMRLAALAVRASSVTLTIPATTTTAMTTPFVSATAPRSLRHCARCLSVRMPKLPTPL